MQGCEMNSNRLSAPVIFEDSSGCYPVCIKNPDIMDNTTASITGRSLFINPGVMTHLCGLFPVVLLTLKAFSACRFRTATKAISDYWSMMTSVWSR